MKTRTKWCLLALGFGLSLSQYHSYTHHGGSIVHLFEWRWSDVADECERYLAPNGFHGVQISPPSEHIVVSKPHRPWWERYQPVSYNLCSRSGTERELRDMISRCNDVGVKIYADVVINHMCMADAGEGSRSTRGSYFNASREEFPSVPYSAADFNDDKCTSGSGNIENYQDIYQVRNCRLLCLLDLAQEREHVRGKIVDYLNTLVDIGVAGFRVDACKHMWPDDLKVRNCRLLGLLDLAQEREHVRGKIVDYLNTLVDIGVAGFRVDACKHMWPDDLKVRNCRLLGLLDLAQEREHVRGKIVDYLNTLVDIGVAGFRVDACKHMWPDDLKVIYGRLHNLNPKWFPEGSRPLIYQEVIDLGDEPIKASEYYPLGRVTEFKYGAMLGSVFRKWNEYKLSDLRSWGESWGLMPSDKALVFVDNHDNQRGHGAGGASILTFWEPRLYKMAVAFMLAHPYGMTRVMSSYRWDRHVVEGKDENDWVGPPSYPDGSTKPVPITPEGGCGDGWVCEHRWPQIRNMVAFRNIVSGQPLCNWWDNGSNQIAFGRGDRGFIVINNDDCFLDATLNTGLPAGTYCDVISGQKKSDRCTGKQVTVNSRGRARFRISNMDQDPFIAIHTNSKL